MNKIRLSGNLETGKYIVLLLSFFLIYFLLFNDLNQQTKAAYLGALLLGCILFYNFHHATTVQFDDKYMYITSRRINETVFLENVLSIKKTSIGFNNGNNFWKIYYKDASGFTKSVTILPKNWNDEFETFQRCVIEKNEKVKIKGWILF